MHSTLKKIQLWMKGYLTNYVHILSKDIRYSDQNIPLCLPLQSAELLALTLQRGSKLASHSDLVIFGF